MELIIKIPEEKFNNFIYGDSLDDKDYDEIVDFIAQGTPLPKGHGRIVDENKITSFGWNNTDNHAVVNAPTIIEADKEGRITDAT